MSRCAIKDLSNAPRCTGPELHFVVRVGQETTGFDIVAEQINSRQSILLGQLDDQSAVHPAFLVANHIERVGVFLCHHLEKTSILQGASSKRPSLCAASCRCSL